MSSSSQQHDDNLLIIAYESEKIEVRAMVLKSSRLEQQRLDSEEEGKLHADEEDRYKIGYRNKFAQTKI